MRQRTAVNALPGKNDFSDKIADIIDLPVLTIFGKEPVEGAANPQINQPVARLNLQTAGREWSGLGMTPGVNSNL